MKTPDEIIKHDREDLSEEYMGKSISPSELDEYMSKVIDIMNEPRNDCISRQAVIAIAKDSCFDLGEDDDTEEFCDEINELPPATPQKEKCKWIKYDYRTVCPKEHDIDNPYWRIPETRMDVLKYCPYCGKEIEMEE